MHDENFEGYVLKKKRTGIKLTAYQKRWLVVRGAAGIIEYSDKEGNTKLKLMATRAVVQ